MAGWVNGGVSGLLVGRVEAGFLAGRKRAAMTLVCDRGTTSLMDSSAD